MKSPFPGMDPYIEACGLWEDFHSHLIEKIHDLLAATVPEHYIVRTGERAYVVLAETEGKDEHSFQTDVGVTTRTPPPPKSAQGEVALEEPATEGEPLTLRAQIATEYRETFIEIYELRLERRLITCVEVLSPSNKREDSLGWEQYLRKRQGLLLGTASLVEIDLLRGGQRLPMVDPWPRCPYTLLVARRERAPYCRVWPAYYHRPLPAIPVPLSKPDPDVSVDLQPLVEAIYARSRYDRDIDYTRPLAPLQPEEVAWFQQIQPPASSPASGEAPK